MGLLSFFLLHPSVRRQDSLMECLPVPFHALHPIDEHLAGVRNGVPVVIAVFEKRDGRLVPTDRTDDTPHWPLVDPDLSFEEEPFVDFLEPPGH